MERWRDVVGYEGLYEVSDLGRVRSVDRDSTNRAGVTRRLKSRIMTPVPNVRDGHLVVTLTNGAVQRKVPVHRIVLEAWVGSCPSDCEACHGPRGVADNSVTNLRWGSHSSNMLDKRRDGSGSTRKVVRSDGAEFDSLTLAAESVGVLRQNIGAVCRGSQRTAGGFGWSYVD